MQTRVEAYPRDSEAKSSPFALHYPHPVRTFEPYADRPRLRGAATRPDGEPRSRQVRLRLGADGAATAVRIPHSGRSPAGALENLIAEVVALREEVAALREQRTERLLDIHGVAELLAITPAAAQHLSRARKLPRVTLPGSRTVRFGRDDVLRWALSERES